MGVIPKPQKKHVHSSARGVALMFLQFQDLEKKPPTKIRIRVLIQRGGRARNDGTGRLRRNRPGHGCWVASHMLHPRLGTGRFVCIQLAHVFELVYVHVSGLRMVGLFCAPWGLFCAPCGWESGGLGLGLGDIRKEHLDRQGIIPRVVAQVYAELTAMKDGSPGLQYLTGVSFIEIYNEKVVDLLGPNGAKARGGFPQRHDVTLWSVDLQSL